MEVNLTVVTLIYVKITDVSNTGMMPKVVGGDTKNRRVCSYVFTVVKTKKWIIFKNKETVFLSNELNLWQSYWFKDEKFEGPFAF